MSLDPEIAAILNAHVSVEAGSAIAYLSMASWADVQGLSGFANHFRIEADGEFDHMNQFITYLNDREYQATFESLPKPQSYWPSLEAAVATSHQMEVDLTERINQLVAKARAKNDYFTEAFLAGFIPQQIKDQAESDDLLKRVRLAGDGQGLLLIDQQMGSQPAGN